MSAVCKTNPVHSAGAGVQTANSETAQTIHDPDAHDPSQGYSLLALLALITHKITNSRTHELTNSRTHALTTDPLLPHEHISYDA